jgi:hypothetical protein
LWFSNAGATAVDTVPLCICSNINRISGGKYCKGGLLEEESLVTNDQIDSLSVPVAVNPQIEQENLWILIYYFH